MNTNTFQPSITHLLDEDWLVVIQAEIDAQPDTLADIVEPQLLGRFDAEMGMPCDPTKYYARLGDIEQYIWGYNDTVALWAEIVQGFNEAARQAANDEYAIENDHDWIRGGC